MATITITAQDVERADAFLEAYLKSKIPDADFSLGSATRDFTVKAMAYIFAYLEAEREAVRKRQSLRELAALAYTENVDDDVDALLSNWFIPRKEGTPSRVPVVLHFSSPSDVTLNSTTRFYKTSQLIFVPDVVERIVVPASSLQRNLDLSGAVVDYTLNITLVAQRAGADYNIAPGRFTGADAFSPYFLFAENLASGYDGRNRETTQELLSRAPTAISVRNLINERSIATVLRERFNPRRVLTVGMGDPEMIRDYSEEAVTGIRMHTGGHKDVYVDLPRTDVTETLPIGGVFARPDGLINVLRDDTLDFTTPVLGRPVVVGDVLRISAGLLNVPREYRIVRVAAHELEVAARTPFPVEATVTYSIGRYTGRYSDSVASRSTGATASSLQERGSVVLAGKPHYRIKQVEVLDADDVTTTLDQRVNCIPQLPLTLGLNEYVVTGRVPGHGQSRKALTQITVNAAYDGQRLRVTYETITGYDAIQNLLEDRFDRTLCDNGLAKAYHPMYLTLYVTCRPLGTVDTTSVKQQLAAYINDLDPATALDVTELGHYLRVTYPELGVIFDPLTVIYELHAPDGQLYTFETRDVVTLHPDHEKNSARLINGQVLRVPIYGATLDPYVPTNEETIRQSSVELEHQLRALGVSDRNVRVIADPALITITTR